MFDQIIQSLQELRRFSGPPEQFWPKYLQNAAYFCGAEYALLLSTPSSGEDWEIRFVWPQEHQHLGDFSVLEERVPVFAQRINRHGQASEAGLVLSEQGKAASLVGIRLDEVEQDGLYVAVFVLSGPDQGNVQELFSRLNLIADIPANYTYIRELEHQWSRSEALHKAMSILSLLQEKNKYVEACMTACNEIVSRYNCLRVSLSRQKGHYVKLQAISHTERFEKKMDAVRCMEAAMEEALDQDEEITWPPSEESDAVTLAHETFARRLGSDYLLSLPLRVNNEPVGVLCCERQQYAFTEQDILELRLLCDQIIHPLEQLRQKDRWIGARAAAGLNSSLEKVVGVKHTFAKTIAVVITILLFVIVFGSWQYKIEAPFLLKTDSIAQLPAPYKGYVEEVKVREGDRVSKGETLLTLDTDRLELKAAQVLADKHRYLREAEKSRASNKLAEMKIARARAEQSQAKLEGIRYQLNHAKIKSPIGGVVVKGKDEKLMGAPVRKGDVLFKVARIQDMYAELAVKERDVHEVELGAKGAIAFVSRPGIKFDIQVERINPISKVKKKANRFMARASIQEDPAKWWRPGMSGIAKIHAGERNILWILTHRIVDFFHKFFWV